MNAAAKKTPQPALAPWKKPVDFTASAKRVLVVEDDIDSVRALAVLVGHMGHHVEYAINGYVALDVARYFRPQVVLLDLGLPGMDGYEFCRRLKRVPEAAAARVVVISAYGSEADREKARAAGCDLYLQKPVKVSTLFEVLEA